MSRSIDQRVQERAHNRCEYCRMHQWLQGATFHIEHVVPAARGGSEQFDNLALACPSCNLHKSDRVSAVDPATGRFVELFNPRTMSWAIHFNFANFEVNGITAIGRATIALLELNHPRKLRIREAEKLFGLFPP